MDITDYLIPTIDRDGEYGIVNSKTNEFAYVTPMAQGYCIHGKYVGGCGIDWMCGPCEMGDGDPTDDDIARQIAAKASNYVEDTNLLRKAVDLFKDGGHDFISEMGAKVESSYADIEAAVQYRRWRQILADDRNCEDWFARAKHLVTDFAYELEAYQEAIWEEEGNYTPTPPNYTEMDEIHEYGYVPD